MKNIKQIFLLIILLLSLFCQAGWAETQLTKEQYQQRMEQWKKLSPEQRKLILNNYKKYNKLPETEKQIVQENYKEWQKLPPPEREKLSRGVKQFHKMAPEQREVFIREKRLKKANRPKNVNIQKPEKRLKPIERQDSKIRQPKIIKDKVKPQRQFEKLRPPHREPSITKGNKKLH